MSPNDPRVRREGLLSIVTGTFYRAVDVAHRDAALSGSTKAGRYARQEQPTLYLSASEAGVRAAMIAHRLPNGRARALLAFRVAAAGIYDLREPEALARVRAAAGDPLSDWQNVLAGGGEPESWRARDWIEASGANGLIDPSRQAPGLWHLVLFRWNVAGAPSVRP